MNLILQRAKMQFLRITGFQRDRVPLAESRGSASGGNSKGAAPLWAGGSLSWRGARMGLAPGALAFLLSAAQTEPVNAPTLSACFARAFAGCAPCAEGAPFTLPVQWFALVFCGVHTCALFPFQMTRGMCGTLPMHAASRARWWCGLTLLTVFWNAVYLALGAVCLSAGAWVRAGAIPAWDEQLIWLAPLFGTLCVLSECQMLCSALGAPFAGQLAAAALLACTAFRDHPLLWPRYAMLLRSGWAAADGFSAAGASAYLTASFAAVYAAGARLFSRYNLLSRGKER